MCLSSPHPCTNGPSLVGHINATCKWHCAHKTKRSVESHVLSIHKIMVTSESKDMVGPILGNLVQHT